MRKVLLSMLTPDMYLARAVYYKSNLLLQKGTGHLERYSHKLAELGIYSIYIEDSISEDIEITDAVTEETRIRCRQALDDTFQQFKNAGNIDCMRVKDVVERLLEETVNKPNIVISLNDMGAVSDETLVHSVNMAVYGTVLAQHLGCSKIEMKNLAEGILLHDVGKMCLDQKILFKGGRFTPEEFRHVKQHPVLGYQILRKDPLLTELSREVALLHHERMDGSGYPYGLEQKEINRLIRAAAIVDVYEALTAERCYRRAMTPSKAIDQLMIESASKLDASLAARFIQNVAVYPNGSTVLLSDGNYAVVREQNEGMPFRPFVRVIEYKSGKAASTYDMDLSKTLNLTIIEDAIGGEIGQNDRVQG